MSDGAYQRLHLRIDTDKVMIAETKSRIYTSTVCIKQQVVHITFEYLILMHAYNAG